MAKKRKLIYLCLSTFIALFLLCIVFALTLNIEIVNAEVEPIGSDIHTCNGIEFKQYGGHWSSGDNYFLSEDFSSDTSINAAGNFSICLNGKKFEYVKGVTFDGGTVTFYDCSADKRGEVLNNTIVHSNSKMTINGGTFFRVSVGSYYENEYVAHIVLNDGVVKYLDDKPYIENECFFNGSITLNGGAVESISIRNSASVLSINGGTVGKPGATSSIHCKEMHITGGNIGQMIVSLSDFTAASPIERGKMYISGSPKFTYLQGVIGLTWASDEDENGNFKVLGFPIIVLNNGKIGAEYREYTGEKIGLAPIEMSGQLPIKHLVGQITAEGVTASTADKLYLFDDMNWQVDTVYMLKREGETLKFEKIPIDLFDNDTKFYRNNLWDTFRSPAYPSSGRPFHLYNLSEPYDGKMERIDFSGGKYVRFERNLSYATVADLPLGDRNRIVNSLKYSTYSTEQAILQALIVSEVLYNSDGSQNSILAKVGLIWSLGEQGFLYTSLDSDGAFAYSGGIGTYVTFKAHNNGDSIVDSTPKNDPLSKDDFIKDSNGDEIINIPSLPETNPPSNSNIYVSYLGRVVDDNGNPLLGVTVELIYNSVTYNTVTDANGYFIVDNILVAIGQDYVSAKLAYSSGNTAYGVKNYANMLVIQQNAETYVYPLTQATDDGGLQNRVHTLTKIDYVASTCQKEGSQTYYICDDATCGCGKLYGDKDGLNNISLGTIKIAKLAHSGGTATCKEFAICQICNQTYGELAAHTLEEIAQVPATCTNTGLTAGSKCSCCGDILITQEITQKLEHSYDNGEISLPPTLLQEGEKLYTCLICGHTKTESLPRLVNDEPLNLLWLIIVLAIVNILEIICIGVLLKRNHSDKKRIKNKNKKAKSEKLNSFICSPLLLFSSVFEMSQQIASILLGVTAIVFGIIIVLLAIKNHKQKQLKEEGQSEVEQETLICAENSCNEDVQDLKQTEETLCQEETPNKK